MSWSESRLSAVLQVKHGFAFKSEFFVGHGEQVVVTPGNFFDEGGFKSKGESEKFYDGPVPDGYVLESGALIVAMTEQAEGLLGSAAIIPEGRVYLHNQRLGLVSALRSDRIDLNFAYYLFNSRLVRQQIRASASGTKVRHTSPARIGEVRVKLPPLETQSRIADILSAYDRLIENNTRRIAILEDMARRLFEEWFVHADEAANWPLVPFTEMASVGSGGTPRKDNPGFWCGSIPFFTPRDAWQSVFAIDTLARITDAGLAKCNSKLYPAMTVFITARGTVGNVLLAPQAMAMNQSCYALQGIDGVPQSYVFFATRDMADELRAKSTGAVFDAIIVDTFRLHDVPKPPQELMLEFDRQCAPMLEAMLNLRRANTNLCATRDLLLPKLISGEIEVRAAEDALEAAAA